MSNSKLSYPRFKNLTNSCFAASILFLLFSQKRFYEAVRSIPKNSKISNLKLIRKVAKKIYNKSSEEMDIGELVRGFDFIASKVNRHERNGNFSYNFAERLLNRLFNGHPVIMKELVYFRQIETYRNCTTVLPESTTEFAITLDEPTSIQESLNKYLMNNNKRSTCTDCSEFRPKFMYFTSTLKDYLLLNLTYGNKNDLTQLVQAELELHIDSKYIYYHTHKPKGSRSNFKLVGYISSISSGNYAHSEGSIYDEEEGNRWYYLRSSDMVITRSFNVIKGDKTKFLRLSGIDQLLYERVIEIDGED